MVRTLTTVLLAYAFIHISFAIAGFHPTRDLPFLTGTALDIGIWMTVCFVIHSLLGLVFKTGIDHRP
ncbi:MAG: hypothetical protein ACTS5I_17710 [Rhodanobacter sp.]